MIEADQMTSGNGERGADEQKDIAEIEEELEKIEKDLRRILDTSPEEDGEEREDL